eukprot:4436908-Pleurochrysis_carterae.AAC.1
MAPLLCIQMAPCFDNCLPQTHTNDWLQPALGRAWDICNAHATHFSRPIQASQAFRMNFHDYHHCVEGVASAI